MLKQTFLTELARLIGPDGFIHDASDLLTYESDALVHLRATPGAVVLPTSAQDVQAVVRLCRREHVALVPRGSGTGLIGGAMAPVGGVMVSLTRMNRILELYFANRCATVQPGLINLWLSQATR